MLSVCSAIDNFPGICSAIGGFSGIILKKKTVFRKALNTWFYKNYGWKRLSRHWLITNSFVECSQKNDGVTRKLEWAMLLSQTKSRFSKNEYAEADANNRSTAGMNELAVVNDWEGL